MAAEGGQIAVLTVNRPKALNALNAETLGELMQALAQVANDKAARVLLITGGGDKAFIAGADIAAMQAMSALEALAFSEKGQRVMQAIEALPIPVIALVNGYALGLDVNKALTLYRVSGTTYTALATVANVANVISGRPASHSLMWSGLALRQVSRGWCRVVRPPPTSSPIRRLFRLM